MDRRAVLTAGALGAGLTLADLLQASAAPAGRGRSFGRARSCILLYMVGGPPQHETWDPKPEAAAEVRGPFGAIPSRLDGLQVGELMPRLARIADRFAVIRTMATDVNAHTGSGYWMLTGHPHRNMHGESIPPDGSDWPHLAALAQRLLPARSHLPTCVVLPERVKNNPGILVAGHDAGFLPPRYEPYLLQGDPSDPRFRVEELTPPAGVDDRRFERRRMLLDRVDARLAGALGPGELAAEDAVAARAWDLLTGPAARAAFDLTREPDALRDRYGRHRFGQSCLLARRLVEAGVRLVTVNWPREPNDFGIGNPVWDTHSDHVRRTRDALMPPMDQGCAALIEDLEQRGLLDETLVVWMGEFGRTPRYNPNGGKDHWGHCFPVALAGGGIRAGAVVGRSDHQGAYPEEDRVEPESLHATIHHCLGIPPGAEVTDRLGRPQAACIGEPIRQVLL